MSTDPTAVVTIPQPGQQAPDVALPDAQGTVHRLADNVARSLYTVLYFYPKDDTPGCTIEACEFRDANLEIAERGAVVWGVSPQGASSKAAFRDKFSLNFPLLADVDHAAAAAYGCWVEKLNYGVSSMGVARRTFLIDPRGRIVRAWEKVRPEGHAAEVLAALDEARASA